MSIDDPTTDSIFSEFESDIRALTESGKRVYVLLSIPIYPNGEFDPHMWLPDRLHPLRDTVVRRAASRTEFVGRVRPVSDRVRASAVRGGAVVLDPVDYLCGTATCPNSDGLGNPLYRDDVHLRARTARERATFIDEVFFGKPSELR